MYPSVDMTIFKPDDIEWVMDNYEFTKGKIAQALKENKWPGYSDRSGGITGILQAEIPLWYRSFDY